MVPPVHAGLGLGDTFAGQARERFDAVVEDAMDDGWLLRLALLLGCYSGHHDEDEDACPGEEEYRRCSDQCPCLARRAVGYAGRDNSLYPLNEKGHDDKDNGVAGGEELEERGELFEWM